MKPHQELCTAKNHNSNLGRRRGRVDLSNFFTVTCVYVYFCTLLMLNGLLLPQDFWVLFGWSDAEACWTSAPFGPPPESHSFLRCSLSLLTQCPPLPVDFYAAFSCWKREQGLIKPDECSPLNSTINSLRSRFKVRIAVTQQNCFMQDCRSSLKEYLRYV